MTPLTPPRPRTEPLLSGRFFIACALLILAMAAGLRIVGLHEFPPGPHYDEAVYLQITRSIAFGGARFFPIVEAYQGREVLWMYLNAPLLSLIHDSIFTLRVTSVFLNLLTVACTMALGRLMFPGRRGWIIGLAAGALMAFSFPQVWLARQAFRAVTLPFMQALALVCLWRGLRHTRGGWGWLLAGGILAGGVLYTYMASRLFPFWLLLGALPLLVVRAGKRERIAQGALFFGALALVAAPMAVYALLRPDIFFGRLSEVTQAGQSVSLLQSISLHLQMFFIQGDPYFRYNVPGRPYFSAPEGALLLTGLAICARRLLARRTPAVERSAYLLALLSPLMIIPSIISTGGLPPSHMRSLGMVPLIFIAVAIGIEGVYRRTISPRAPRTLVLSLLAGVLMLGGGDTATTYARWASSAEVFYETDADLAAAARWLVAQQSDGALSNTDVYVAARDRGHPTVLIEPVPPITWLGTNSLFRPAPGRDGLAVFPRSAPPPADWLAWLEPGRITEGLPLAPDGRTAFEVFHLTGELPLPVLTAPPAPVANPYLTLLGIDALPLRAGEDGEIVTYWRIDAAPPVGDFTPLLQLEDEQGHIFSRTDVYMTETDRWQPGAVLMQRIPVSVPAETAPLSYTLRLAWVARAADDYAHWYTRDQRQGGIWETLGTLQIRRPAQQADTAAVAINTRAGDVFTPGVRLLGWGALPGAVRPGEKLPVTLYWQAEQRPEAGLQLAAALVAADGSVVPLATEPLHTTYPLSRWRAGDVVAAPHVWPLPRDLAGGVYQLRVQANMPGAAAFSLGNLQVEGAARLFEQPAATLSIDANFGDIITLVGATATVDAQAQRLSLNLVWQARADETEAFQVFIHLVDASGAIVAQQDSSPQQGAYPTLLWARGEYVPDAYSLPLEHCNACTLRIGLYRPDSGARLSIIGDSTFTDMTHEYVIIALDNEE